MKKIFTLLLLLLLSLQLFAQTIYYVKPTGNDANSGTSWGQAFRTVQKALSSISTGQIWVAAGTYYPDEGPGQSDNNRGSYFTLKTGVFILGGFAGTESSITQRNLKTNTTILSGDLLKNDGANFINYADNAYHVVRSNGITDALLDGLTITGGNAGDPYSNERGGGMSIYRSSLTINNCRFIENSAYRYGGAIFNNEADLMLINSSFIGNRSSFEAGGALYSNGYSDESGAYPAMALIINCSFTLNSAYAGGGAVYSGDYFSKVIIYNSILWGNSSGHTSWGNEQIDKVSQDPMPVTYSIVQGGYTGTGNIDADPLFVNAAEENVHLQICSPAIDAGNNEVVTNTTDADGAPRIFNLKVDMGPYESQARRVLYVKAGATGLNDGSSWTNAFTRLQDALAKAPLCHSLTQVWVAKGTYYPDEGAGLTNNDRTLSFALKNNAAIYGGFNGTETELFMRSPDLNETILSGNIDGLAGNSGNAYHVVTATSVDSTAILDGFTISDGNANATNYNYGGGMYNTSASPTVINCTFKNNAAAAGGALFNQAASPTLTHCRFLNNRANSGGGMYNRSTTPVPSNSSPVINGCSFFSNIASIDGGAIYNDGSSGTVVNCVFWSNGAATGGGLFNQYTNDLRIINCSFALNSASSSGGALYNWNNYTSRPTLANCILWSDTNGEIAGDQATVTYSLVQGSDGGTGNLSEDPLFVDAASGDLHLQPCSPAIDAGNNASVPPGITTDRDGAPRTASTQTDMGAYEFQVTIYVKHDATGLNNGTSWANAYTKLQDALAHPTPCPHQYMIWVAQGTYYPDEGAGQVNNNRSASFRLKNNMAILGGFAGTETSLGQRIPASARYYQTVLSGEIDGVTGNAGNAYHVVRSEGVNSSAVLDGFTITWGNANGPAAPDKQGGGLYNTASPTIRYCTFNANTATNGGAIYNTAAASIINCIFTQNRAAYGGAIYNQSASPDILNGLFWKNSAPVQGGAIYDTAASPQIINGSFNGNTAPAGYGGAIRNVAASAPTVTNSILWGDSGGEISNAGSTPVVSYSIVQGGYSGEGNLDADPQFADVTTGKLRLTTYPSPSPAIDAGNNAAVTLTTDVYGDQRIYNDIVDMGADEFYPGGIGGPEPLVLTCPADFTLRSDTTGCGAVADFTGAHAATATSGEPPVTLTYSPAPGTLLPVGDVLVTVTATDAINRTRTCSFWVTVVDSIPPLLGCPAVAGMDFARQGRPLLKATDPGACTYTVKGSELDVQASDNCPGPLTYSYTLSGATTTAGPVAANSLNGVILNQGRTTLTWMVQDAAGNQSTCSVDVLVTDKTAPQISNVTVDKPVLYPPNHKLQDITVSYTASDNCEGVTTTLSVSSNEPQYGTGSGDTGPDWQVTDNHRVKLRAERSGTGTGRIYTITITAKDAAGNETHQEVEVTVPHDKGAPVTSAEAATSKEVNSLAVSAVPNPSSEGFTLQAQSPSHLPLTIKVLDATGRVIETRTGVAANGTLYIGDSYRPGTYYLQVLQGGVQQTLKLVKQAH